MDAIIAVSEKGGLKALTEESLSLQEMRDLNYLKGLASIMLLEDGVEELKKHQASYKTISEEKLEEEALALLRIITPIMLELSHFRKPILKSLNLKD